jgi:signal transduction histidine kinase
VRLNSLHTRLAAALLGLLLLAGGLNLYSTLVTTDLYLREVNQSMNFDLARNIARLKHDRLLTDEGELRTDALDELLHWMMVVNPGPHFYLLDPGGEILAYDRVAGPVVRERVDLGPIRDFLAHRAALEEPGTPPRRIIVGDDPREPGMRKIFSVSPLPPDGDHPRRGYLYIVLASPPVESAMERLRSSYLLRLSTRNGLVYLSVVLLTGWWVFAVFTRPLRRLAARMAEFHRRESSPAEVDLDDAGGDEVQILERAFDEMSRRIEEQLAEIEEMAATRRELVANVSHDLRTPIASLRGYLETLALKEGALTEDEREEYLRIALRQGEQLGKLVAELFELTKLDAREVEPELEPFQLAELVQDNVQRFQLRARDEGIELRADFDPDLPPVRVDIGLMERALENLLDNALGFTPPGGEVRVGLRQENHHLRLTVDDTGCGIAEEDLPHVFDRYYRARSPRDPRPQGAGLGLAITRRIVELHGSDLEIRSTLGEGTSVSFTLETVGSVER